MRMNTVFLMAVFISFLVAMFFIGKLILDVIKARPQKPHAKRAGLAVLLCFLSLIGFGMTQSPEQRAEIERQRQEKISLEIAEEPASTPPAEISGGGRQSSFWNGQVFPYHFS